MNATEKEQRMATAKLGPLMLSMGLPTFIAQLVYLLYNIVDRIYIGHIPDVGALALTGVGLCLPLVTLITAFSNFVGAGGAPLAAIALGKGDRKRAEKILSNGVTLLILFSACLMILFYAVKRPFLYLFGASDATFPYADSYLQIYLIGTIFVQLGMGLTPFISAQGQPTVAMVCVLLGAVANIILDPVFIFVFGWGTRGAALATIVSQAMSAAWALRFLTSEKASLRLRKASMKPEGEIVRSIAALGVSPFIMTVTESLITTVFNRGASLYGNDLYVGSITILQSVMQIIFLPVSGFSQGVQPIISYNYGAGSMARVKEVCRKLVAMTTSFAFVMALLAILFPRKVAGLFTTDAELIAICGRTAPVFLAGMLIFGIQSGCQQCFVAMGQAKKSLFFALFRKVILLIPLALILPAVSGNILGLYLAEPISDATSAIVCGLTFYAFYRSLGKDKARSEA